MDIERFWYDGNTYFKLIDRSLIDTPIGSMKVRVFKMEPSEYHDYILDSVQDPNKKFVYLSDFGVDRDFQHLGYGRTLLRYVINCYHGCNIYLRVSSIGSMSNEELIEFYKSEGFREVEGWQKHSKWPVLIIEL